MRGGWGPWALVGLMACGGGDAEATLDAATAAADTDTDTDSDADADADTDSDADADADADADTDSDSDSGTAATADTAQPQLLAASCARQPDHALRVDCSLTLSADADATWRFTAPGVPERAWVTTGSSVATTALGLRADTAYDWSVEVGGASLSGTVATDPLPVGVADLLSQITGSTTRTDAIVSPFACGGVDGLVAFDGDGEVVWYETVPATGTGGLGGVTGYDVVDGTVLVAWDADHVRAQGLDGRMHFDVSGLPFLQHHDVGIAGDRHVLLHASNVDDVIVDGFTVLDAAGQVLATWDYRDHVDVPPKDSQGGFFASVWPQGDDWSHGNGLEVDGDHVLISMRYLDGVVRVDADPASPTFGSVDWTVTGQPGNAIASDVAWPSGEGFDGQHHAMAWPDGRFAVFDNRTPQTTSRGLIYTLDLAAGTAAEAESYALDRYCSTQGSFYPVDGGVALTCEPAGEVSVFAQGAVAPEWTLKVACGLGPMPAGTFARGLPLDWD